MLSRNNGMSARTNGMIARSDGIIPRQDGMAARTGLGSNGAISTSASNQPPIKKKFYPARAPGGILSSEFVGINSDKAASSGSERFDTSESSDMIMSTSEVYPSSERIMEYLRDHPDYQHLADEQMKALAAAVLSGLLVSGGILLIPLSGGVATPIVAVSTSFLIATGSTGLGKAIPGIVNGRFSLSDYLVSSAISGASVLLTFGTSFTAGYATGILLSGRLTGETVRIIGSMAGAIVGAATQPGLYSISKTVIEDEHDLSGSEILIQIVSGAIAGGSAGLLGVNCVVPSAQPISGDAHRLTKISPKNANEMSMVPTAKDLEEAACARMTKDERLTRVAHAFQKHVSRQGQDELFRRLLNVNTIAQGPEAFHRQGLDAVRAISEAYDSITLYYVRDGAQYMLRQSHSAGLGVLYTITGNSVEMVGFRLFCREFCQTPNILPSLSAAAVLQGSSWNNEND